jgi:redox-sensitive bicupin YhaK (pirin superfamily)
MFPLIHREGPNPLDLFQIWLNLPRADKFVEPHFTMLWDSVVPRKLERDSEGRATEVCLVAGRLGELKAAPPPPKSWASRPDTDVAIWTIKLEPGARWTLPAAESGSNRRLYFFEGSRLSVGGRTVASKQMMDLRPELEVPLENGPDMAELLLLQGKPIGEPVVQHGPFVMNSRSEILQAFEDYQRTQFGGWKWPSDAPVHPREEGRFARHADGRIERP